MWEECIRCNDAPAVNELGYCGHCHWAVRAEVEEGLYQLREYLRADGTVYQQIKDTGELPDDLSEKLNGEIEKFKKGFNVEEETGLI